MPTQRVKSTASAPITEYVGYLNNNSIRKNDKDYFNDGCEVEVVKSKK